MRRQPPTHFSPSKSPALESVRSLFGKFRRILDLNNKVLEIMARMESALGGEYIFDSAFLRSSVAEIGGHVHQVAYNLNVLSGNRYPRLYDRYEDIRNTLEDLLQGGFGPCAWLIALPLAEARWEAEPLTGVAAAALSEVAPEAGLLMPDGFLITSAGVSLWVDHAFAGEDGASEETGLRPGLPLELAAIVERETMELAARAEFGGTIQVRAVADEYGYVAVARRTELSPAAVAEAAAEVMTEAFTRDGRPPLAVRVCLEPPAKSEGVLRSLDPAPEGFGLMGIRAWAEGQDGEDRYLVRRAAPHSLVCSTLAPRVAPDGKDCAAALRRNPAHLARGTALLRPDDLNLLAGAAMAIEAAIGRPVGLAWRRGADNRLAALDLTLLPIPDITPASTGLDEALASATVAARGGATVQSGAVAGPVVHVTDGEGDHQDIPPGAVLVTRSAAPGLAPLLRRAGALITEVGSAVGHLAAIARERHVPAIFGLPEALRLLPEGEIVTVDAGESVVYQGRLDALLDFQAANPEFGPSDPEYITLRRLLRFIRPLHLTTPGTPEFTEENCRTYHDIIHFCHVQAMEELLGLQERHGGLGTSGVRPLELNVPLDLSVLDLEGGVAPGAGNSIPPAKVSSIPLRSFLRGLSNRRAWSAAPQNLGLKDILSGFGRGMNPLAAPEYAGRNLAVAARNYCNISLRLGYHFTVVDSWLGDKPAQNYIYFRFVGGFADETRRARRAVLVRRSLERLGFRAEVKGDLVTARLMTGERRDLEYVLFRLGELTGFTRQLDLAMESEAEAAELEAAFLTLERDHTGEDPSA